MSTTYFNSTENYLKRDSSSGASTMLGPNASIYGGYIYQRTTPIAHSLGYVPLCRVFYEPFGEGTIVPPLSLPIQKNANNIVSAGGTPTGPGLIYWADTTNLYIRLYFQDASLATSSFPIYWVIYKDFRIA